MLNAHTAVSFLFFFVLIVACAKTDKSSKDISPSDFFCVGRSDLAETQDRAFDGSRIDIAKLYWHYIGCEANEGLAFHWAIAGADLCDEDMQVEVRDWFSRYNKNSEKHILEVIEKKWSEKCLR